MDQITHPISGEQGFFCSTMEKELFDALLLDYKESRGESE